MTVRNIKIDDDQGHDGILRLDYRNTTQTDQLGSFIGFLYHHLLQLALTDTGSVKPDGNALSHEKAHDGAGEDL